MATFVIFIEDKINNECIPVIVDTQDTIGELIRRLIKQFDLPDSDPKKYELIRINDGIRLAKTMRLGDTEIAKGDLLQLTCLDKRYLAWQNARKVLEKIAWEIIDTILGDLKDKAVKDIWKRIKGDLDRAEAIHPNSKQLHHLRKFVDWIDRIGGLTKLVNIAEKLVGLAGLNGKVVRRSIASASILVAVALGLWLSLPFLLSIAASATPASPFVTVTPTILTPPAIQPPPAISVITVALATFTPASTPSATPTATASPTPTATPLPTLTLLPNRSPIGDDQTVSTVAGRTVNITLHARDPDRDPLSFRIVSNPGNGTLSGIPPNVIYTPNPNFVGSDIFTFRVNDGEADSNTAAIIIIVNPDNLPPVANDDQAATDQDVAVTINVLANDVDPNGDPLTIIAISQGESGTVASHGNGTVTYSPNLRFSGQDRFTYTISDGRGATDTATVFVTINPVLADLAVTQTDSLDPVTIGDDLTYEIRIINNGPAVATGVVVSDQLPSIAVFRLATPSQGTCSQEKGLVTCHLGNLTTGAEATIIITVTMGQGQDQAQVVTNSVNVEGNQSDPNPGNNASLEDTTVTQPDPPDLTVIALQMTGFATINAEGQIEVPIHVVVKNQGELAAGIFKVSTEYTGPEGTFLVPFTVPGQNDIWYPYTSAPLAAGSEVTFVGTVTFGRALQGEIVSLKATADSCRGDELMPVTCRVDESDEGNNDSAPISVSLPSSLPPEVKIINPKTDSGPSDNEYAYDGFDQHLGLWYTDVVLQGSATDPEDGPLDGSALVWTTSRSDIQSAALGSGTSVTARLYSNVCPGVLHEITLTATDSMGKENTDARKIWIWTLCGEM